MKDMTFNEVLALLEERLQCDDITQSAKLELELLRRFEALEKENQELQTELDHLGMTRYYCPVCLVKTENDNLSCCGNCAYQTDKMNCNNYDYDALNPVSPSGYCKSWQSDGLTRAEREGK